MVNQKKKVQLIDQLAFSPCLCTGHVGILSYGGSTTYQPALRRAHGALCCAVVASMQRK